MSTLKRSEKFHCFDDCQQSGCPGHTMEVTIQDTSEVMMVYVDGRYLFGCDPNEWNTLKKMVKSFDYNQFDLTLD